MNGGRKLGKILWMFRIAICAMVLTSAFVGIKTAWAEPQQCEEWWWKCRMGDPISCQKYDKYCRGEILLLIGDTVEDAPVVHK